MSLFIYKLKTAYSFFFHLLRIPGILALLVEEFLIFSEMI